MADTTQDLTPTGLTRLTPPGGDPGFSAPLNPNDPAAIGGAAMGGGALVPGMTAADLEAQAAKAATTVNLPGGPVTVSKDGTVQPGGTPSVSKGNPTLESLKATSAAGTTADALSKLIGDFEMENKATRDQILSATIATEREQALQKQIDDLGNQLKRGMLNIESRPIPLEDIGGEQERLLKNTATILSPLTDELRRLETTRMGTLDRLGRALGFRQDEQAMQLKRAELLRQPIIEAERAVRDYVLDLARKYPDAGIDLQDTAESAAKKIAGSPIYKAETVKAEATTDDIREYQFAKNQGFKGSFLQFVDRKKGGATGTSDIGGVNFGVAPSSQPTSTAPTETLDQFIKRRISEEENKVGQSFGEKKRNELKTQLTSEFNKQNESKPASTGNAELKTQWLNDASVAPIVKQLIRGDIGVDKLSDTEQRRYGTQIEQARSAGVIPPYSKAEMLKLVNEVKNTARQDVNVKNFADTRTAYETARSNAQKRDGAGDVVLMRMIAKITDPTTGVREEEFKTFSGAQSKLAQYGISLTKQMWSGDRLTQSGRDALLKVAQERYDQALRAYDDSYNFYLDQVSGYGGTAKDFLPRIVAPSSPASVSTGKTSSGLGYKVIQ